MTASGTRDPGVLERRSPSAFLVAGGLFVVFAVGWGAFAFTAMDTESVQNVVGPAGWAVAFLGLIGLSGRIATANRKLSLAALGLAVLGFAGAVSATVGNSIVLVAVVDDLPEWFTALQLPLLVGIVVGFSTCSLAALRTEVIPRHVGFLLLAPAVLFVVNIVRVATLGSTTPIWAPFVLGAGQALSFLAIGYALHTEREFPDRSEPAATGITE
ncbi:hypothetical protein ACFQL1_19545 [Halomicroarcula sp. GCM10025709]|uniref:hypothetical protein n=1 Tax=Haloarcula TaxID=2237 RepID=UPI0024C41EC3|nr:hypothetical protein [Halomicroarcula sp. YJ-61-S]